MTAAIPRERDSARRRILVVALLVVAFGYLWVPDGRRFFGHPLGDVGIALDQANVTGVCNDRSHMVTYSHHA
ncbi:MAG: hypothetical protein ACREMP_06445 [Candidatus Tyrphobacter sp.]